MLKLKFQKLQKTIVNSVNPASIMDLLYQESVIGADDMWKLQKSGNDSRQQCRELLALLHLSEHPQAFVQLYAAIREERHLNWLVERIDFTELMQQPNVIETTGKVCLFRSGLMTKSPYYTDLT